MYAKKKACNDLYADGNVLIDARSVTGRWKKYFEELMNEGNERE